MRLGGSAIRRIIAWAILPTTLILTTHFASAEEFYGWKQINLVVGSDPGGGYDFYARLLATHWSKYIPGHPKIVVQNMNGAGSLGAANYVTNVAPRDGLTVGALQNTIGYEQMMGISGSKTNDHFDVLKMNWLGSMSKEVSVPVLWNPSPVGSLQDLIQTKKQVTTGSTGAATSNAIFAHLLNSMFGTHIEVIEGYPSQGSIFLAMENGEVQGSGGPLLSSLNASKPDWLRDKKVTALVQIALEKDPSLPDVPLILDFVKTQNDRQEVTLATASLTMCRPYMVSEGVPPDRVKILRDSFMAAMGDPELLQDARKSRLEINATDGAGVHGLLSEMYSTPQDIIDKVTAIFVPQRR
jgi:tripartite-type tricarboxylate transporter receptor subunit TctC